MAKVKVRLEDGLREVQVPPEGTWADALRLAGAPPAAYGVKVDGMLLGLYEPAGEGAEAVPVDFDDPDGREMYRHSTAHIMASAVAELFPGTKYAIGPAIEEGYLPRGFRNNEFVAKNAAQRAIEMLAQRLAGGNPPTEIPLRGFEKVPAAAPIASLAKAKIAIVTGGGMVPRGNPDKLKQAFADAFGTYSIEGLAELPAGDFKGIHGGYDSTWVDEDPDRVVPLDALRQLQEEGAFGSLLEEYVVLCGIGTNVAMSKKLGAEIAEQLKRKEVSAAIYTST